MARTVRVRVHDGPARGQVEIAAPVLTLHGVARGKAVTEKGNFLPARLQLGTELYELCGYWDGVPHYRHAASRVRAAVPH